MSPPPSNDAVGRRLGEVGRRRRLGGGSGVAAAPQLAPAETEPPRGTRRAGVRQDATSGFRTTFASTRDVRLSAGPQGGFDWGLAQTPLAPSARKASPLPPSVARRRRRSTRGETPFAPPLSVLYDWLGFTDDDASSLAPLHPPGRIKHENDARMGVILMKPRVNEATRGGECPPGHSPKERAAFPWRWGESNPRPTRFQYRHLRAQPAAVFQTRGRCRHTSPSPS